MSARSLAVFLAVLAVIGLLAYGLISKGEGALAAGDPAPVAELPLLDGSGTGSLADYEGKWVLVNVWASWCGPCRTEAPAIEDFYRRHRDDGLEVVGINTEDATEPGQEFVREFGLSYPQLRDGSGEYAREELKTAGVPENFLVDPNGEIAVVWAGAVDREILAERFEPALEAG